MGVRAIFNTSMIIRKLNIFLSITTILDLLSIEG